MSYKNDWSSDDDEILIDFVRKHEAIYNIKSKEYRKTQLKQKWWHEIGDILSKNENDCCKRWCYIRDYYVRRRGKSGTFSSGKAAKKRADLLSFLDGVPSSQRNTITNVVDINREDKSVNMESIHDNSERTQILGEEPIKIENIDSSEEEQSSIQEIEHIICDNNADINYGKAKGHKKRKHFGHARERVKPISDRNRIKNKYNENDLFFSSMAKIVQKLPQLEQVQLRLQIGSLVGNAELRHISSNSP